jgi:hypothetical protein
MPEKAVLVTALIMAQPLCMSYIAAKATVTLA